MTLLASEYKAIGWYATEHKLKIQLSTPPTMYFKDSSGEEVKQELPAIIEQYKASKKRRVAS
ncbi:MAG TPA: hypothetical protein VL020_04970 [Pseudomonadales bacterium]|nr:hypothetical protein [Pseudomonadales bacterium]